MTRLEAGEPGVWFVFTHKVNPIGCVEKAADGWVARERVIADGYVLLDGLYGKRKDAVEALVKAVA